MSKMESKQRRLCVLLLVVVVYAGAFSQFVKRGERGHSTIRWWGWPDWGWSFGHNLSQNGRRLAWKGEGAQLGEMEGRMTASSPLANGADDWLTPARQTLCHLQLISKMGWKKRRQEGWHGWQGFIPPQTPTRFCVVFGTISVCALKS
jgi:hypothetical protein